LFALGYINDSPATGAVATLGVYNDLGMSVPTPGTLVAVATGVVLKNSVQEVPVTNTVLAPGIYFFAIQPRDDFEPVIPWAMPGTTLT
jgi:hypothetical protein